MSARGARQVTGGNGRSFSGQEVIVMDRIWKVCGSVISV